jgi:hypothetical protein
MIGLIDTYCVYPENSLCVRNAESSEGRVEAYGDVKEMIVNIYW